MDQLHAIILAAGNSSRYGSLKQLLFWENSTLLQHTINLAQAVCEERVTVVLGAHAEVIQPTLPKQGIVSVFNPVWQEGMASSIRTGISALPARADAALILACDQPLLKHSALSGLIECWRAAPARIVASKYKDTNGVPVIFPQPMFRTLRTITGDQGAKQLLHDRKDLLTTFPMPEAAFDIDCRDDLRDLPTTHIKLAGTPYDNTQDQR